MSLVLISLNSSCMSANSLNASLDSSKSMSGLSKYNLYAVAQRMSFSFVIKLRSFSSHELTPVLQTISQFRLSPSGILASLNNTSSLLVRHAIMRGYIVVCSFSYFFWYFIPRLILSMNSLAAFTLTFLNDSLSPNWISQFFAINGPISLSFPFGSILFNMNECPLIVNILTKKNVLPHPVAPCKNNICWKTKSAGFSTICFLTAAIKNFLHISRVSFVSLALK